MDWNARIDKEWNGLFKGMGDSYRLLAIRGIWTLDVFVGITSMFQFSYKLLALVDEKMRVSCIRFSIGLWLGDVVTSFARSFSKVWSPSLSKKKYLCLRLIRKKIVFVMKTNQYIGQEWFNSSWGSNRNREA